MPTWKLEIIQTGKTVRNQEIKDLNDNKKFWKKKKPFFADKGLETNNIIVKEKSKLITNISLVLIYSINILSTLQVLWS